MSTYKFTRALLRCKIELIEGVSHARLNVFVTHLEHKSEKVRFHQIKEVLQLIREWEQKDPDSILGHILLGDLNTMSKNDYSETQWNNIIQLRIEKNWTDGNI